MAEGMASSQRKARGGWSRRIIAGALALALSACSTVVPKGPQGPVERPQPTRQTGPAQPTITTAIPQDVARQRVALLVPLSGANAGVGQSIANATQMAVLDSRSDRLRITSYDTAQGAAAAAQRALADGNKLILGPLLAEDVRAVAPIAHQAGVPLITFSNDASVGGSGTYLLGYSPVQSITRVVDFARSKGMTDFAGLVPNELYGERASTAFLRAVEQAGGKVLSLQTYDRGPGGLGAAVARLAKNGPYQAVLIAGSSGVAATSVPLLRKNGAAAKAEILGTELWNADTGISGVAALDGAWFASVSNGLYRQYAVKYRARFGKSPYRLSSLGYDAVLLTVRIMRDWPVGEPFPESRLRDPGGFAGIDGAFRFTRDGMAERALEVQEVRPSGTIVVSPAPNGFGR